MSGSIGNKNSTGHRSPQARANLTAAAKKRWKDIDYRSRQLTRMGRRKREHLGAAFTSDVGDDPPLKDFDEMEY